MRTSNPGLDLKYFKDFAPRQGRAGRSHPRRRPATRRSSLGPRWLRPAQQVPPNSPIYSACRPSPRAAKPLGDRAGDPMGRKSSAQFFAVSGCALPGWAESSARKPGDSANRATHSQPRVRLTAAPLSLRRVSRARRFNCFGDKPKQLNRLLRRRRAVPSGTPKWQPLPQLDGTALRGRRPSDLGGTERYCAYRLPVCFTPFSIRTSQGKTQRFAAAVITPNSMKTILTSPNRQLFGQCLPIFQSMGDGQFVGIFELVAETDTARNDGNRHAQRL